MKPNQNVVFALFRKLALTALAGVFVGSALAGLATPVGVN